MTVTAKGQVTFKKDILIHLGIKPDKEIEHDLMPNEGLLKAAGQTETISSFIRSLAGKTKKVASTEEINAAAAESWADKN